MHWMDSYNKVFALKVDLTLALILRSRGIVLIRSSNKSCKILNYVFCTLLLLIYKTPIHNPTRRLFLFPNGVNFLFTYASRLDIEAMKITPAKKNRPAVTIKPAYEVTYEGIAKETKGWVIKTEGTELRTFDKIRKNIIVRALSKAMFRIGFIVLLNGSVTPPLSNAKRISM
uniref:Uncharacterized protein n=1 Tax=Glossina austeni TaxID=7395 RepID=A0A1A9VV58_GLOAU